MSYQYFPALPGSPGDATSLTQLGSRGGDSQDQGQEAYRRVWGLFYILHIVVQA